MTKILPLTFTFLACAIMSLTTGCASGGFTLTRRYAQFVNSQNIIIRIILYILTSVVFAVTILIDMVVNNTLDFWGGKVSAGSYEFRDAKRVYQARHEILDGRRRSTIDVYENGVRLQRVLLQETASNEIEMYVDGVLRTKVRDINSLPVATLFNARGAVVATHVVDLNAPAAVASNAKLAH